MKPVFFPFTDISEASARGAVELFGGVLVVGVSGGRASLPADQVPHGVDLLVPEFLDEKKLEAVQRDMVAWGGMVGRRGISSGVPGQDAVPFRDSSSVDSIRSMIRSGGDEEKKEEKRDVLFDALLFLRMAQEYDRDSAGIDEGLASCDLLGKDLFSSLKGEGVLEDDEVCSASLPLNADRGESKTLARIKSWSTVYARMGAESMPENRFFVTDSPAVFGMVREKAAELNFDCEPVVAGDTSLSGMVESVHDCLGAHMESPCAAPVGTENTPSFSMDVMRVRGVTPVSFFRGLAGEDVVNSPEKTDDCGRDLVIGLLRETI